MLAPLFALIGEPGVERGLGFFEQDEIFRKTGGEVKLLNLNRRNVELLVATKLTTIFEIFGDEQDAVNSFFPGRDIKPFDILEFVKAQKRV